MRHGSSLGEGTSVECTHHRLLSSCKAGRSVDLILEAHRSGRSSWDLLATLRATEFAHSGLVVPSIVVMSALKIGRSPVTFGLLHPPVVLAHTPFSIQALLAASGLHHFPAADRQSQHADVSSSPTATRLRGLISVTRPSGETSPWHGRLHGRQGEQEVTARTRRDLRDHSELTGTTRHRSEASPS